MNAIRLADVDAALDVAERRFNRCWSCLVAIKGGNFDKNRLKPLIDFQPLLATALFSLSKLHAQVSRERQARVAVKTEYVPAWFSSRMAFLSRQQERLLEAIHIGRGLGDAFAWFFYQNEMEFLRQHMQETESVVMSTGVGGIGELQCAKNLKTFAGCFVVHHCITGMLRLGDVTLINLDGFKVAGIGELKSHSDRPGHVRVSISVLGERPAPEGQIAVAGSASDIDVVEQLTNAAKARLQRQMRRIEASHKTARKPPDSALSIESAGRVKTMETLLQRVPLRRVSFASAGNGLVLFAFRVPPAPLSKRLKKLPKEPEQKSALSGIVELQQRVSESLLPDRSDNAILLAWFYYRNGKGFRYLPGMTHPFWWPLSARNLKPVVFRQVVVGSAYNPVWLFKELEGAGFEVDSSDARRPRITRRDGDHLFEAGGFEFYLEAIQQYLMDEGAIVSMLATVFESMKALGAPPGAKRVDLLLHQKFGSPPSDGATSH